MRHHKVIALLAVVSSLSIPAAASAASGRDAPRSSSTTNCWGVVTSQLAHVEGGIGEHASSQATPRLGLGNVARLFFELGLIDSPTVSDLGSLLAQLDEYDETACPIQ